MLLFLSYGFHACYEMVCCGILWYARGMLWYNSMVWYGMVWCGMVWYGIWYGMVTDH